MDREREEEREEERERDRGVREAQNSCQVNLISKLVVFVSFDI